MKKFLLNLAILCLVTGLAGCASNTRNENSGYCAAAGIALGALSSNPLLAMGGAIAGVSLGRSLPSSEDP